MTKILENIFSIKNEDERKVLRVVGVKIKLKKTSRQNEKSNEKWFLNCYNKFILLDKNQRFELNKEDFYKCFDDNTDSTDFEPQYLYHPAWAIRKVLEINIL